MSEVIRAIKLSQLENRLLDVKREIKRLEGMINSPNIKKQSYKNKAKKKLEKMINKQTDLTDQITEAIFLNAELK